jgi:dethiobiotin synthetase
MRLGCLNHALLTRAAIRASALPFAGWIANGLETPMAHARENLKTLSDRFGTPPLAVVPSGTDPHPARAPFWAIEGAGNLLSH